MKAYLLSIAAGLLVGIVYSLLGVRSPAPPLIALAGLLGILLGEQIVPAVTRLTTRHEAATPISAKTRDHPEGRLPDHEDNA